MSWKVACACTALIAAAGVSATNATGSDTGIAAASNYVVVSQGAIVGSMTVRAEADKRSIDFGYSNNGRGPKYHVDLCLDRRGLPSSMAVSGVDLLQVAATESLERHGTLDSWHTAVDAGDSAAGGFYMPLYSTPEHVALLAAVLLKAPQHSIALLPAGRASLAEATHRVLTVAGQSKRVTLYLIAGASLGPTPIWLEPDGALFAQASAAKISTIRKGWEATLPTLIEEQSKILERRDMELARTLGRSPRHPVVFRHVRLFDAEAETMRDDMRVVVEGQRIGVVQSESSAPTPAGSEVIEGRGKTLLPGLWDMHVHIQSNLDGELHLANGVTNARDMGNAMGAVLKWQQQFGSGTLIGPRLLLAGLVDGRAPTANLASVKVTNEPELREAVDRFAAHGYVELKIYSSFPPALVPLAVQLAHEKGLRAGGHVPAGLRADDVVRMGFDDISHLNFMLLNFMGDDSQNKTNSLQRMLLPAEYGGDLDPNSPAVTATTGMPPLDVLQMATLGPARMMKLDQELGSVTTGKLADLILVSGDPSQDIGTIRDLEMVVKGGVFYDPREIDAAVEIAPR